MRAEPTHRHYEHVALFHRGDEELGERVATRVADAVARDEPVLLCLQPPALAAVAERLGGLPSLATTLPPDTRYSRPTAAMRIVHEFAERAATAGASKAWSIGTLQFGAGDDDRWLRYEAAVDDVLGHLPLGAVCTYDTAATSPAVLDAAHSCHGGSPAAVVATAPWVDVAALGRPALELDAAAPSARRDLARHFADDAAVAPILGDLELAGAELMTNAVRHGAAPSTLRCWRRDDDIVLEVTDHGPGITDPYPDLRPPRPGLTGYGWWLIGQLVDDLALERVRGRTVVTAGLRLPPTS